MAYRFTRFGSVLRLADGADIPPDPDNVDWQAFLAWQQAGNVAEPAPPPPPRSIAKTTLYRRATDAEIQALVAFLQHQVTPRQRLMWEDAEGGLVLIEDVEPVAVHLFGAERAAELLA